MTTEYLLNREMELILRLLTPSNCLVCRVILHTGLRVSDVLTLKSVQIKSRFWVTEAKTGKRKMVGLPGSLVADIKAQAGEIWAFPSPKDSKKHRTRQAVWADIKRAARAMRLPQNVGAHSFRKVYAVDVLAKYQDIEKVRKALNHGSYTTTMLYCMAAQSLAYKRYAKAERVSNLNRIAGL